MTATLAFNGLNLRKIWNPINSAYNLFDHLWKALDIYDQKRCIKIDFTIA